MGNGRTLGGTPLDPAPEAVGSSQRAGAQPPGPPVLSRTPAPPCASAAAPWPLNVPGAEEALKILGGEVGVPESLARVTRIFSDGLSGDERAALKGTPMFDASAIRRALACHWRLIAAMTLASPPPAVLDKAALEAMYGETDSVFEGLRSLERTVPLAVPVAKVARMHLASIAVDFSEFAQRLSGEMGRPEPPTVVRKHTNSDRARLLAIADASPAAGPGACRKQVALWASLGAMALGAAIYHGAGLLSRPPPLQTPAWAPATMVLLPAPPGAPQVLVSKDGRPLSPEQLKGLEQELRSAGRGVREVAPGQYLVGVP